VQDAVVQVEAKDWKAAEKILREYLDQKTTVGAKEKSFGQARQRLPGKATLVSLLSVPRAVAGFMQYAGVIMQSLGGPAPGPLPKGQGEEAYVGVSLTLQSGSASFDLW